MLFSGHTTYSRIVISFGYILIKTLFNFKVCNFCVGKKDNEGEDTERTILRYVKS